MTHQNGLAPSGWVGALGLDTGDDEGQRDRAHRLLRVVGAVRERDQ
jgi:hypothetical protein